MELMTAYDQSEVIDAMRGYGFSEQDIEQLIENLNAGYVELSWVADFIDAMEIGDDDEAWMCACALGIA